MTILKSIRLVAWLILVGIMSLVAYVVYEKRSENSAVAYQPSAVGGAFRLTTHKGTILTDTQLAGAPYLVFFGFTHCPDICPATLYDLSQMLAALEKNGQTIKVLFVTVDPERDTPEKLNAYLQSFNSNITGLTGSREEIDNMLKSYRAYAKKVPLENGNYTMDHTSAMYLMGRFGTFVTLIDTKATQDKKIEIIKRYL